MKKCFEDVGLAPCELTDEAANYKVYVDHKRGSLNPKLWKPEFCLPSSPSLADAIEAQDDMQIVTRLDAQDDLDASDDSDDSDYEGYSWC